MKKATTPSDGLNKQPRLLTSLPSGRGTKAGAGRFFLLFSLVAMLSAFSSYSQIDDKILWKQDSLELLNWRCMAVHPNGNIIGIRNTETYELDGRTGKFIREFKKYTSDIEILDLEISKDGKCFITSSTDACIVDYQTGLKVVSFNYYPYGTTACFFPDSKRVLISCGSQGNDKLKIYNIETKETQTIPTDFYWFDDVAVSPDGRYFAVSGIYQEDPKNDMTRYARLILWDATTLKPLKTIWNENSSNKLTNIRFTDDMKFIAFYAGAADIVITSLVDYSITNYFNSQNHPTQGVIGYCYLGNDYMALSSRGGGDGNFIEIINFKTSQVIFHSNEYNTWAALIESNPILNSLIITDTKYGHIALDLSKIIGTGYNENPNPEPGIWYSSGSIYISNIFNTSPLLSINTININGQTINSLQIVPSNYQDTIQIPLPMPAGVYIVQVKAGSKSYSAKILAE